MSRFHGRGMIYHKSHVTDKRSNAHIRKSILMPGWKPHWSPNFFAATSSIHWKKTWENREQAWARHKLALKGTSQSLLRNAKAFQGHRNSRKTVSKPWASVSKAWASVSSGHWIFCALHVSCRYWIAAGRWRDNKYMIHGSPGRSV